jgi:C-terminal processing protease CtpA/Prc
MIPIDVSLSHYKRADIQEEILANAQDREVAAKFNDNFGKRPDVLRHASDILEMAKQGATSFHASEEIWKNPLQLDTSMRRQELDNLRTGWDLVIDIRGNGGGASAMGDFLFSYLSPGKFHQYSKVRTKLSRDARSDATTASFNGLPQDADLDGLIVTYQNEELFMPKPHAFFSGRVFLLVDNGTFSGASCFATTFRDYGVGTTLGYETGGLPISFGNLYIFELDNSGIQCGVSFKQFFNSKPRPGDDEHGVIPDIPINDKVLQPYQNEDDPVLAFTLDHIKKTRKSR